MRAQEILPKNHELYSVDADESALTATILMKKHAVGALVVMRDGDPVGIVTERDVVTRLVAEKKPYKSTKVSKIMTPDFAVSELDTPISDIHQIMSDQHIRHMPIADKKGVIVGMVSMRDVNAQLLKEELAKAQYLSEYIHGRA